MNWIGRIICIVLIVAGLFCGIAMDTVWSQYSAVVGTPSTIETKNDYELVAKFDLNVIDFESEDDTNFTFSISEKPIKDFDGENNQYVLLFNDLIISDVQWYAGKIVATFDMNFYGTSGELVSSPKMNILIEFTDSKTLINIDTKNENNSIAYLNQYMNVNGATFKVCLKGVA